MTTDQYIHMIDWTLARKGRATVTLPDGVNAYEIIQHYREQGFKTERTGAVLWITPQDDGN